MLFVQNKIKPLLQYSKLLKIVSFVMCGIFFTTANANLPNTNDQANKPEIDSDYFLNIDSLQPTHNPGSLIVYVEKENPNVVWVVLPIKSSMTDYYKAVANVVATEFHKRIDERSIVPHTKFLIGKNMDNGSYQLLGSAYKKFSSTTPILEVMKKKGFTNYAHNIIYRNYNVERNIGTWRYLGLPTAPDPAVLELTEDNKFIRYDYYKSFQYNNPKIHGKCFCTSYFLISDYTCNVDYIKTFEQDLQFKHKETLKKIILEINEDSKKYLVGEDLYEISQSLQSIIDSKS